MKLSAIALLGLVCAASLTAQSDDNGQDPSCHETEFNDCTVVSDGEKEGEDWIAHKYEGGNALGTEIEIPYRSSGS